MAKRKRAARKPVSRKPSAVEKRNEETTKKPVSSKSPSAVDQNEEAFLNFVNQNNNKENSRCEDSNDFEVVNNQSDSVSGSDFPSEAGGSSSSSSSSFESDEAYSCEDGSADDSAIDKRSRKSVKAHGKAKQKPRKLSKKEGKENHKSSRVLRSSNIKQKEFETPHLDQRYNKEELKAALGVIKKVMKMDEAQPFNVPVDPVALGKPDYFNIIDTPMDFSTICSNLQNNVKYMNSEDVLKDVKYIWENCFKYNKKGEYVVYLVKRVKKKFMKYWIAAGLYNEQSRKPNENLFLQPPTDHAMRHNRYEPMHQADNAMDGISHMHQNRLESNLPHRQLPPLNYSQPYQSQPPPPPSTIWPRFSQFPPLSSGQSHQLQHPQPSANQPQYSQSQRPADCSNAGRSHFQPSPDKVWKHKKHPPSSSLGPTGPHNQSQPVLPQLSHNQPLVMQQPQQSTSDLQASQFPGAVDYRHSNMPIHTDYTRYTGYVPWGPADPTIVSPIEVNPLSNAQSNEPQQPQASHGQHQSCFQTYADIEHSLTDSATRGIRCALNYSAGPIMNNQGQEDQLGHGKKQPEQTQLNQNQGDQSQQPPKKTKKGRGPTRCLFLNDLPDGKRIVVPINKLGQPVGPESSKLTSFLGTIARNGHMAPLTYVQWRHMPDSYKEQMWQHVQTKFDIDPSCKTWVMKSLATKWRDWKAELKAKHYYPHMTDEERLKDCHPRIVPDQWQFLVSYWNSDDAKKLCATNRANRSKQKATHASGPKSFARVREEERMKRPDGKEPTRAELYILTHTRKDGQPVDETAAANIAKLRELAAKKQNSTECSDDDKDTFCQVMGEERRGYVRTYGLGPSRDDIYGPRPNRDLLKIAAEVKKSASEEVSKVLEKMEAMEQKYANMENQIARLTSSMQIFLEKFGGPSNIFGSEQVLNTPNSPQHFNQPHLHSTSSSHAGANGSGYA